MKSKYQILLTSNTNSQNCEAEYVHFNTSLTPANEALLAQVMTDALSKLYEKQEREMLGVWEIDALGNESRFFQ